MAKELEWLSEDSGDGIFFLVERKKWDVVVLPRAGGAQRSIPWKACLAAPPISRPGGGHLRKRQTSHSAGGDPWVG